MGRNRLYTILGIVCVIGYSWLFFGAKQADAGIFHACYFRSISGIPCPTCGSTRAVVTLLHGDIIGSVLLNPIGIFLVIVMMGLPFWLVYDLVTKKATLFAAYQKVEQTVRIKWIAALLIALIVANWIWNFYKQL